MDTYLQGLIYFAQTLKPCSVRELTTLVASATLLMLAGDTTGQPLRRVRPPTPNKRGILTAWAATSVAGKLQGERTVGILVGERKLMGENAQHVFARTR